MVHALSPTMTLRDFENGYWYLESWMESLQAAVAPFGITTTIVNPGFFRTELLTERSTNYVDASIADGLFCGRDCLASAPSQRVASICLGTAVSCGHRPARLPQPQGTAAQSLRRPAYKTAA